MAAKKSIPSKRTVPTLIKRHKLRTLLIVIACVGIGVFSYERYLDARNVSDMKQLLSSFEELKENIESDTDQNVDIEADCGSIGKFAEQYGCSVYLLNSGSETIVYEDFLVLGFRNCNTVASNSSRYSNSYYCSMMVRSANRSKAESIFYLYDTSPGRPR